MAPCFLEAAFRKPSIHFLVQPTSIVQASCFTSTYPYARRRVHFPAKPVGISDFFLALAGLGLAGGSMFLLAYMTMTSLPAVAIYGNEYLAIYSKPKIPVAPAQKRHPEKKLDHTPVGNIRKQIDRGAVAEFELLDATSTSATLRTPQGRIIHAARGAMLPGGGKIISIDQDTGRWLVRTTNGVIR